MQFIKKYWAEHILVFFLLAFVFFKFSTLTLPYFWDELGVYSRAALYLHDNGLSLQPKDLPPELSRGHPLLFSCINAVSFSLFGDGVVTGHITALFFSILFIVVVYSITKKIFSSTTALCVAVSVLVQPIFVAQSVMVLPEILLALCMLLAVYFFYKERYLSYVVLSSLAILIKESAIILPFVVLCSAVVVNIGEKKNIFKKKYITAFIPLFVFGIFLLIQKQQNGWYLFPYHASALNFSKDVFISQFADFSKFLTMEQGRLGFTVLLLIVYPLIMILNWKSSLNKVTNVFLYIMLFVSFLLLYNDFDLLYCVSILLAASGLLMGYLRKPFVNAFIVYIIFLFAGGLFFSSLNFYMNRYILFLLPSLFILYFYVLRKLRIPAAVLYPACICVIITFAWPNMKSNTFHYDEDMSYGNYIRQQQQSMQYIQEKCTGEEIHIFANFPLYHGFTDARLGYTKLTDSKDYQLIKDNKRADGATYILIAKPGSYDYFLPPEESISIDKKFLNSVAEITIYKRNTE